MVAGVPGCLVISVLVCAEESVGFCFEGMGGAGEMMRWVRRKRVCAGEIVGLVMREWVGVGGIEREGVEVL